ncbi:MAG: cytidine deaminase [Spirochaetia bacterium]
MNKEDLINEARKAAETSYSPYSKFRVGAALLCADGSVYRGTNIENRSYGLTICAERSAFFSAVSDGKKEFTALAIHSPDAEYPLPPCGACRQVITEFVAPDFPVHLSSGNGDTQSLKAEELYPFDSLKELAERQDTM